MLRSAAVLVSTAGPSAASMVIGEPCSAAVISRCAPRKPRRSRRRIAPLDALDTARKQTRLR